MFFDRRTIFELPIVEVISRYGRRFLIAFIIAVLSLLLAWKPIIIATGVGLLSILYFCYAIYKLVSLRKKDYIFEQSINGFPYGTPELKQNKYGVYGFFLSLLINMTGAWVITILITSGPPPDRVIKIVPYSELGPPPSITDSKNQTLQSVPVKRYSKDVPKIIEEAPSLNEQKSTSTNAPKVDRGFNGEDWQNSSPQPVKTPDNPQVKVSRHDSPNWQRDEGNLLTTEPQKEIELDRSGRSILSASKPSTVKSDSGSVVPNRPQQYFAGNDWIRIDTQPTASGDRFGHDANIGIKLEEYRSYFYRRISPVTRSQKLIHDNIEISIMPLAIEVIYPDGSAYRIEIPVGTSDKIHIYARVRNQQALTNLTKNPLSQAEKLKQLLLRIDF